MERGTVTCYHRRWALPEPRNMDIIVTVPTFFYFITRLLWGIDGYITLISTMKSIYRTNVQIGSHFSFHALSYSMSLQGITLNPLPHRCNLPLITTSI